MIYKNKDIYDGSWIDDKRVDGTLSNGSTVIYYGKWINDHPEENGEYKYPNGDVYIGHHAQGYKEGKGKMIYNNQDVFDGVWSDDYPFTGTLTKADGT